MRVADRLARRSDRGRLLGGALAWLVTALVVGAARLWWSVPAAIGALVVCVAVSVIWARRYPRPDAG